MAIPVYPTGPQSWTALVDGTSPVVANDVNTAYVEITAIEQYLGNNPHITPSWSGTFSSSTTTWATVSARINNLEVGLNTIYSNRVSTTGGSTILPVDTATVPLKLKSYIGSTQNLIQFQDSSGNVNTFVNSSGYIDTIDGGTA